MNDNYLEALDGKKYEIKWYADGTMVKSKILRLTKSKLAYYRSCMKDHSKLLPFCRIVSIERACEIRSDGRATRWQM